MIRFGFRAPLRVVIALVLGVTTGAANPLHAQVAPAASHTSAAPAERNVARANTPHLILISIDGLRPDAIEWAGAETLGSMIREGAYSLDAQTILPSLTLPSHTSMLTGVPAADHGVVWNRDRDARSEFVEVPTVFDVAHAAGLHTAAIAGKRKLRHLFRTGTLDYAVFPADGRHASAAEVAAHAAEYLASAEPNLLFVHLPDPDVAGHSRGWMSGRYRTAVRAADAAVAQIRDAARKQFGDDYVLIVTADHGGHGFGHGSEREQAIPWIAWGEGVRAGRVQQKIHTYDTAATVLWLLGVARPDEWRGVPIRSAFTAAAEAPPVGAASVPPR